MTVRKYYNIHNIVKFSLNGPEKFANSLRYSAYRTTCISDDELDFAVNFGDFHPDIKDCFIVDDKYYIKRGYFYCKLDSYKFLKWSLEYTNLETGLISIKIYIDRCLDIFNFQYILIEGFFIDSLIHYILLKKGCCLLHASCISEGDKGLLFIARGGAGKTTISTRLIDEGFNFISDNFTILTPTGYVMGFVEPLNVFGYNINQKIKSSLSRCNKIKLMLTQTIYYLSRGYIKIFTRINPSLIFSNITTRAKFHLAFMLTPNSNLKNDVKFDKIEMKELTARIRFNQQLEFPYFDKYLLCYSYVFPESKLSKHWDYYENVLNNILSQSIYEIEVPLKLEHDTIHQIMKVIRHVANT